MLADFRVDSLQHTNSLALETPPTFVGYAVEKVMPEASAAKEARLPVETILTKLAGKIIENFIRSSGLVFEDRRKGIFSAFSPKDQMKAIKMSMECAEKQHHVAKACPGHLQI